MAKRNISSFAWMYPAVLLLVAVPTFVIGVVLAVRGMGWTMLAAGCASIVAVLVTWPIVRYLEAARLQSSEKFEEFAGPLNERMQQLSVLMYQISEQQLISDRAKQVAFREHDRDALRRAIQEEIGKRDWEAAMALADDMERVFGYKQEADRFRDEVRTRRDETVRRQINEAIAVIERHIRIESWDEARSAAHQLLQRFPHDAQVQSLPQEIENRRESHKRQLLESLHDAQQRNDIDGGIEILKQLDAYLTPAEAEMLQELARTLFKEKLNSLRTRFALAVQEHRWAEAKELADVIVRDFPNTRIAQEVSEKLDALRERAGSEPAEVPR